MSLDQPQAEPLALLLSPEAMVPIWNLHQCATYRHISPQTLLGYIQHPGAWRDSFFRVGREWRTTPNLQLQLDFELARLTKLSFDDQDD